MDLISLARDALATGPLCDPCLGRLVADRSFGLGNDERGRALRVAVALADDEPFEPGPDHRPDDDEEGEGPTCWVCEGHATDVDAWAAKAVDTLEDWEFETYQVGTRVPPLLAENDRLLREDVGLDPEAGELLKSELNREVGKRLGERTDTEVDFTRPDVLVLLHLERWTVERQVNPAFVYGRYRKLERDIPQTEWPCRECGASGKQLAEGGGEEPCDHCGGSGYLYDDSVEGYVAPHVREAMDGAEATFHGAGREDVDALMLGTGRPFVVEVTEPRTRDPDPAAIEAAVAEAADGAVGVTDLALATYETVERVKELDADKTYRMAVALGEPVDEAALAETLDVLAGATVAQDTPQRVDHRRADLTRTRDVHAIDGALVADDGLDGDLAADRRTRTRPLDECEPVATADHVVLELSGEGGLYVKELVSGDDGRTDPNLAELLGVEATVTALDVVAVEAVEGSFCPPEYRR